MPQATRTFHNRIVLTFDFDETLAPSTFPRLLTHLGFNAESFKAERVAPLEDDDWEHPIAEGYALINAVREAGISLTEADLADFGRNFPLYDGVEEMFDRVRGEAESIVPGVEVEFNLLTAGFAEVPENSPIAYQFTNIYGGAYHFDEDGQIAFVKRVITHPEKMRYLLQLAKGLPLKSANPQNVYQQVPEDDWHVPIDQMIYVGDGKSDMPAFQFMHEYGGIGLGIFDGDSADDWDANDAVTEQRRVENLAPNSYAEDSELLNSLLCAVRAICNKIALRKLSRGQ